MKSTLPILFSLFFIIGCQQQTTQQKDYSYLDQEIAALDNNVKLRKYWEEIGALDQKYRSEETFIVQQHGPESKEYKEIWDKIRETDEENLAKVERLLAKFGYPHKDKIGRKAASAPYMVIHHAPSYEAKERNFHFLYDAYQNDNLKEGAFSFYLNRMYKIKTGKRYEVGAVFKEEDRINGIIEELKLVD